MEVKNEENNTNNDGNNVSNISVYVIPLSCIYHQYKIGSIGAIISQKKWEPLIKIDTIQFSKWEQQIKESSSC